jgi:WD40 repeat protein
MPATQRRLTHTKLFSKIAERFHGDINVAQGVPYSIAAVEDFIAIGSSDGSVRLFDHSEQEIKTLIDKSVQSNGVTCLDIKRVDKSQNIFVVSGHVKGHIAIYELKGLFP